MHDGREPTSLDSRRFQRSTSLGIAGIA